MRAANPGLQFAPTQRLEFNQYFISIGDRNIVIGCKLPYPKWPNFKSTILDITRRIANVSILGQVERYSVKYVNLIEAPTLIQQASKIKMAIRLGEIQVNDDPVSLQVHRKEDEILHILSVTIGAEGTRPDGKRVFGAVVDIDSIRMVNGPDFGIFVANLEQDVEVLRQANKAKFFACLTDNAIKEMGPIYE